SSAAAHLSIRLPQFRFSATVVPKGCLFGMRSPRVSVKSAHAEPPVKNRRSVFIYVHLRRFLRRLRSVSLARAGETKKQRRNGVLDYRGNSRVHPSTWCYTS